MRIPEELSKETLERLIVLHVQHFQRLVEQAENGSPSVRRDECETYLATWLSGQAALQIGQPLPQDVVDELIDALHSGDYDGVLKAEELEAVEKWLAEGDGEGDEIYEDPA